MTIKTNSQVFERTKNSPIVSLLLFRLNDIGIIWDVGLGYESESINQGRSYVDKNINISLCFFSRYLSYSGNGGVICVSVRNFSMSINYSMFYNCVCSQRAGAIYFYSTNSCLRMIWSNRCSCGISSPSRGIYAYLSTSQINYVKYLSLPYCSYTTNGYCAIK